MLGDLPLFLFLFILSSSRSKRCNVSQVNSFQLDRQGYAGKLEVCWEIVESDGKTTFQEWKTICADENDFWDTTAHRVCRQLGVYEGIVESVNYIHLIHGIISYFRAPDCLF